MIIHHHPEASPILRQQKGGACIGGFARSNDAHLHEIIFHLPKDFDFRWNMLNWQQTDGSWI
jgi:hypothetical protein